MIKPLLKYPGSKWRLAPWIISHFPVHEGDALIVVVRECGEVVASAIVELRLGLVDAIGIIKCADRLMIHQCDATIARSIQTALERVFGQEVREVA